MLVELANVVMVDSGADFNVALLADGSVVSWGDNSSGQLGDGTLDTRLTPVQVKGLGPGSGVVAVAAGMFHAMALKADGTVLTWGANVLGQLGDGTQFSRAEPVQVVGLGPGSGVIKISAGFTHTLALESDGTVLCWGRSALGACGIDTPAGALTTPVQPVGLSSGSGVIAIAAGANVSIALKSTGAVLAWGNNNNGQVGIGTQVQQNTPIGVTGLDDGSGVVAISTAGVSGANSAYALKSDGTVLGWGANASGQLGDGTTTTRTTPVQVMGLAGDAKVIAIAAGGSHVLALREDGSAVSWGSNDSGQLGDGTTTSRQVAGPVSSTSGLTAVATGRAHSIALRADGTLVAWGTNGSGQLGDDTFMGSATPVMASGITGGVIAIAEGTNFSLALKSDGSVLAWGANTNGQLGDGTTETRRTPVIVSGLGPGSGIVAVAAGADHALALASDGTVLSWGANGNGQLGDGTTTRRLIPTQVSGLGTGSNVISISAAAQRSFVLEQDGSVLAFGVNSNGLLGDGSTTQRLTPVAVVDLAAGSGAKAITSSQFATYVLFDDGSAKAWGNNDIAALGDGTVMTRATPVAIDGITAGSMASSIACYTSGGLLLKSDGSVLGWGSNLTGGAGDGTTEQRRSAVPSTALSAYSLRAIAGGDGHVLGITDAGGVIAWGSNGSGQLGDGTHTGRPSAKPVPGLSNITALAASPTLGGAHSMALDDAGRIWAWGANVTGQLGNGTSYPKSLTPAPVLTWSM
jgi:alpha-tubulin suppressor-like RCC1 family protein